MDLTAQRTYENIKVISQNLCQHVSVDGPEVQSRFSCLEGVNVATAVFVVVTKHLLVVNHQSQSDVELG